MHKVFDNIKAEEQLKNDTYDFLKQRINQKKKVSYKRFAAIVAAAAAVMLLCFMPYNLYSAEAAYLDIDVNPSIELGLNKFDRVISVKAYNEEGQEVLDNVSIKNKSYEDALLILIEEMISLGYIKNEALFTATLQTQENEEEWLDALQNYINSVLQANHVIVEQDIFAVDADTKTHAHDENLTPAKYLAILEAQEVDPDATFDNCRDHTISEIKEKTHRHTEGGNSDHDNADSDEKHDESEGIDSEEDNLSHDGSKTKGKHGNDH